MVGERDREQDAVRWKLEDTTAISIPPPFNNEILQYNLLQQQHYAAMAAAATETAPDHWDDDQSFVGSLDAGATEKGVHFPATSPTYVFSNGQISAPMQGTQTRYKKNFLTYFTSSQTRETILRYIKEISLFLSVSFRHATFSYLFWNHFPKR